jgi:hypothetical protein
MLQNLLFFRFVRNYKYSYENPLQTTMQQSHGSHVWKHLKNPSVPMQNLQRFYNIIPSLLLFNLKYKSFKTNLHSNNLFSRTSELLRLFLRSWNSNNNNNTHHILHINKVLSSIFCKLQISSGVALPDIL